MNITDVLSGMPAFKVLTSGDFDALVATFTEKTIPSGQALIQEGKKGDQVFVLLEGELRVHRQRGAQRVELNKLAPGAWVGLVALIDSGPRSATCEAVGSCRVASLPLSALQLLMSSQAPLSIALFAALGAQLAGDFRNLDRRIRSML